MLIMGITMIIMTGFVFFFTLTTAPVVWTQEKIGPQSWIREAEEVYAKIDGYTAIFHKQERIGGKLKEGETVFLKFKKPFKVYMKWIKEPYAGRELLYVHGWNENRIKIHEGGIMGVVTVNLDPRGSVAMKGNRHPITESGVGHLVKRIGENLHKGIRNGDLKFQEHDVEMVYGRKTNRVEIIFPQDKTKGYYCYRVNINLDVQQNIPIKIQVYDWDDVLIETYGYEGLNLNPRLTDTDFDPKNPEYKFK